MSSNWLQDTPVPSLNRKNNWLTSRNIEVDHPPHVKFYTDPSMYQVAGTLYPIQNGDLILSATGNFCPRCKQFAIDFLVFADFD